VNLPDGNGVDLIPILRANHEDLPVVLSTGHVELDLSNEKKRIISLMKPYELGDLLVAIENVTAAAVSISGASITRTSAPDVDRVDDRADDLRELDR
jgi:FixJ family two-component response regulator